LRDDDLLTYFDLHYPQTLPWHIYHPQPGIVSSAISALHRQPSPPELFLQTPPLPLHTGDCGPPTAPRYRSILPFNSSKTLSLSSKSSPSGTVLDPSTPASALFEAAPSRAPYAALAKRLPVWGPRTPVSLHKATWISA
jgi:hypothetical protein